MNDLPRFRLADPPHDGVTCDEHGLAVGGAPLLAKIGAASGLEGWALRPLPDLEQDLSLRYGVPIDLSSKVAGFGAVARALNEGDVPRAQIAALHLRLPAPPPLSKLGDPAGITTLARQLLATGLLKRDWNPDLHPRWPAGSPDSTGGEFAPGGSAGTSSARPSSHFDQPLEIPWEDLAPLSRPMTIPKPAPRPGEVLPPPLVIPRERPRSAECDKEWEDAWDFCKGLERRGLLGKGDYAWMGRTVEECARGQVSAECGGNPIV